MSLKNWVSLRTTGWSQLDGVQAGDHEQGNSRRGCRTSEVVCHLEQSSVTRRSNPENKGSTREIYSLHRTDAVPDTKGNSTETALAQVPYHLFHKIPGGRSPAPRIYSHCFLLDDWLLRGTKIICGKPSCKSTQMITSVFKISISSATNMCLKPSWETNECNLHLFLI